MSKIPVDPDYKPEYLWPTNASQSLASSFAETRSNHFHFGIDIRTQQRTGFPCYAIADGYVARIKVSPYGYGRALYLQLHDGNMAVYAHLQRFAPVVEQVLHAEQMRTKCFACELFFQPEDLPFKKGEVVAFTGASGVGSAHLHFEIRNAQGYLNPNLVGLAVPDTIAPSLQRVGFFPLDIASEIASDYHPYFTALTALGKNRYSVPTVPEVYGPLGIGVTGFDQVNDSPHQLSFYGLDLYLDGERQFSARYDYFDYYEEKMIDLDRDYGQRKSSGQAYHHLWKDPSSTVEFYKTDELLDTRHYAPGRHTYEIAISDFAGNTARVTGQLEFKAQPLVPPASGYSSFWGFFGRKQDDSARQHHPVINNLLQAEFLDGFVCFTGPQQNAKTNKSLFLQEPYKSQIPLTYRGGKWIGKLPLQPFPPGYWTVELRDEAAKNAVGDVASWFLQPVKTSGGRVSSDDGQFSANFDQNAVYRTLYARLESRPPTDGSFCSHIYTIEPDDMPIRGSASVSINLPAGETHPEQLGLYGISKYGAWKFLGNDRQKLSGAVTGSSPRLGAFALRRDAESPRLTWLSPGAATSQRRPTFRLSVRDELSGLDDRSLNLEVDGQFILLEYDPEARTIFGAPDTPLKLGTHQVVLTLRDFCGNETRVLKSLKITG